MKASIVWWDLSGSQQTIESLRNYLSDEGVQPWCSVRGLCLKFWISDPENNRWGAVSLWEHDDVVRQPLPPNRAFELIGYLPTQRISFDIEAAVEGVHGRRIITERGAIFHK
jgi:hypothetical protein